MHSLSHVYVVFPGKAPLLENVMLRTLQESHCIVVVNTLGEIHRNYFHLRSTLHHLTLWTQGDKLRK